LASKILNSHLLERTPTPDFIDRVFSEAEVKKWSFYFIGSKKQSLEKAVNIIKNQFPTLHLKGYHHGYFSKDEEIDLIKDINNKKYSHLQNRAQSLWAPKDLLPKRVLLSHPQLHQH
jgi:N-acetylglucosaminyldiphosphoundecaprenol N-acetyl-beta-D-mannosaminyltransferase